MRYERERIHRMRGYTAGEQPLDATTIKLNTNENPYPPSPRVAAALARFDVASLRRYPQPTADRLRDRIAARLRIARDQVLVTNGGDELLRLAFTTFLDPDDVFGTTDVTYSLYPVLAEIQGCPVATVALGDDWRLPSDFAAQLNARGVRLCCIVNPHAPSGALTAADSLADIAAELRGVLLIDEAYADFVDPELHYDGVELARRFDNVLLLRTFSKGYSLAGLRVGFAIGHADLIAPMLGKTRDSYNVDALSQTLACAAFEDLPYAAETWAKVRAERARLADALRQRGFVVPPSQSNFVLATVPKTAHIDAGELAGRLKHDGVLVRYFSQQRLDDKLRITIGDREQNTRLLAAIDRALEGTGGR